MKFQKYNKKINAWVKFEKKGKKTLITNVKETNPTKRFVGIPIRR